MDSESWRKEGRPILWDLRKIAGEMLIGPVRAGSPGEAERDTENWEKV